MMGETRLIKEMAIYPHCLYLCQIRCINWIPTKDAGRGRLVRQGEY